MKEHGRNGCGSEMPGRLSYPGTGVNPLKITKETVRRLEEISALELTETERARAAERLDAVLRSMEVLREAEPMDGAEPEPGAGLSDLRGDFAEPSMERPALLQNAPQTDGIYFAVPKTVE